MLSSLYLGDDLIFILETTIKDNKIDYKNKNKIKIAARWYNTNNNIILYKMVQSWDRETNKITEIENFENKWKKIKGKKYPKAGAANKCLKNTPPTINWSPTNILASLYMIIKNANTLSKI